MTDERKPFTLEAASAYLQLARERKPFEDYRLTVAIRNVGGLSAHQTVDVESMAAGFDWTARQIIVQPARPLSLLSPEELVAVAQSVRMGQSWHASQRERAQHERVRKLATAIRTAIEFLENNTVRASENALGRARVVEALNASLVGIPGLPR